MNHCWLLAGEGFDDSVLAVFVFRFTTGGSMSRGMCNVNGRVIFLAIFVEQSAYQLAHCTFFQHIHSALEI